jgi:uncharacterized protein YeaO (DUF488 family)
MYRVKRIYDTPAAADGYRVLVDRLWPRGVRKESAALDLWSKDIAPSPDLRTWFGHKPERFDEFRVRYREELRSNPAVQAMRELHDGHDTVTLLYAARDPKINHAVVLEEFLNSALA